MLEPRDVVETEQAGVVAPGSAVDEPHRAEFSRVLGVAKLESAPEEANVALAEGVAHGTNGSPCGMGEA